MMKKSLSKKAQKQEQFTYIKPCKSPKNINWFSLKESEKITLKQLQLQKNDKAINNANAIKFQIKATIQSNP